MDDDVFTAAIHADDELAELPDVAPALRPATTFERHEGGRIYRRDGDETTARLEAVIGAMEHGHSVVYPSGMAAVAAVLHQIRPRRIALPEDVYYGVREHVETEARRGTWQTVRRDELDAGDVDWIETPSNPKCLITDLAAAATAARRRRIVTVVDGTFATPVLQQPLDHGIDFSLHATTKYIGGHSDAMGGVVSVENDDIAAALRAARSRGGAVPGTLETWLTLRGIRTLPLRVGRQSASAARIAAALAELVAPVWYPGLTTHPAHDVATRQMRGYGGVLSFELASAEEAAAAVERLRIFTNATSLGGVESLAEHRLQSDPDAPPGLIRLSIGLEDPDALLNDLVAACGL
jgi:cystathionine gamma-synthase